MRVTKRQAAAQEKLAPSLPRPHGANSVTVSDGQQAVASITLRDPKHHLFDASGKWLGSFATRAAALAAIPPVTR